MALLPEPKDNGTGSVAMAVCSHGIVDLESISKICPKKDGGSQPSSSLRQGRKGVPQSNSILRRGSSPCWVFQDNIIYTDTNTDIQNNTNAPTNTNILLMLMPTPIPILLNASTNAPTISDTNYHFLSINICQTPCQELWR